MDNQKIETIGNEENAFFKVKSYSIGEIMAAGGPNAFSKKMGKSGKSLLETLNKLPKDAFLTEEEIEIALNMLKESK